MKSNENQYENCCANCNFAEGYGSQDGFKCKATGYGVRGEQYDCDEFESAEKENIMENEIVKAEQLHELSTNVFGSLENFKEIYDIGKMFASSTLVPQAYQGKAMDCTIAVDMANRMGISPMMVMQNLYVVRGKPSWSGQACTALIEGSGKFKNVKHVYTGEKGTDTWGCYLQATRIEDGEIVKGTEVTIATAKAEGWYSKPDKYGKETSKWQTMPELMLAYRASAFFARVHIPNALMGVAVEGEVEDIAKEKAEVIDPFEKSEVIENDSNN